jgi:hypothetical protein
MELKNLLFATILLVSSNALGQQTFVNKEWESTDGAVGQINRTVSAIDAQENLIVVSNKLIGAHTD